jgi:ribose transport system substrate-binding protein
MMDALVKGKPLEKKKDEVALIPVTMANLNSLDKSSMQAPKGWTP